MDLAGGRGVALAVGSLLVIRAIAAAVLPLSADEAYYWLWSRHLAAGYYDHPPAIAFCIRAGTLVFGNTPLGVRAGAVALSVVATWFVWRAGALLLESEQAGARAALLFNLTLMIAVETMAATPDAPMVAAAAAFLFGLAKLSRGGTGAWWLAAGAAAGLGLLSKYTAFFMGLGVVGWFFLDPPARRWLITPWPYLGGAIAFGLFSPNLIWNAEHHWITFAFQFGRVGSGGATLRFLFEFLLVQLVLATPFIFVLAVIGIAGTTTDPRYKLLAGLIWPSVLYFAVHALHDRVQGNWPSFLFPALSVAAVVASVTLWRPAVQRVVAVVDRLAAPVGALLVVLAYAQALFGVVPMGRADPLARLLAVGFPDVAATVDRLRTTTGANAVLTSDYASTSWLAFYLPSMPPVVPVTETQRWEFAPPADPATLQGPLLYVSEKRLDKSAAVRQQYRDVTELAETFRKRHGKTVADYVIYRVAGPKGVPEGRLP